ncbi:MAG: hypothetical protein JWL59_2799 [Chthoniobacteraceae bacterium]|nr:hypothetical protein [Chthoniobacteraceae bacterium]
MNFKIFRKFNRRCLWLFGLLLLCFASARAAEPGLGALTEVAVGQLSDRSITLLGQAALGIRFSEWKHAESKNFVYHFFQSFIATPVSVEAEFYYGVISKELEKETAQWERKAHIFIFEKPADWAEFQKRAALDPWTGGIHAGGELFIQRNPELKFKGNTLGHEIAHLVVHRFFGAGVPLWLNEGYAEYAASRGYAAFNRARGYNARPRSQSVDPAHFIALADLSAAATYPRELEGVAAFYGESERLVRFLSAADKRGFNLFFEALAKGNRIESALGKGFAGRFSTLEELERQFKEYAVKDHGFPALD